MNCNILYIGYIAYIIQFKCLEIIERPKQQSQLEELLNSKNSLEYQMERARKQIEEKEKQRKAFFKKQQKYYCQLYWKKLADENKKNE